MIENWAGSEVSMDRVCSGLIWCCTHLSVPVQGAWDRGLSLWPGALMCSDAYTDLCSKTKNSHSCIFSFILAQAEFSSAWILWSQKSGQLWKRWHFSPSYWGKFSDFKSSSWETILESIQWEVSCVSVIDECWASLWPWPLLQDAIEAIAESAFKTSPYPVILSFENHVDSWVFGGWENCLLCPEQKITGKGCWVLSECWAEGKYWGFWSTWRWVRAERWALTCRVGWSPMCSLLPWGCRVWTWELAWEWDLNICITEMVFWVEDRDLDLLFMLNSGFGHLLSSSLLPGLS